MQEHGVRHLPMAENGKPIGMVAARVVLDPDPAEFVCEVRRRETVHSDGALAHSWRLRLHILVGCPRARTTAPAFTKRHAANPPRPEVQPAARCAAAGRVGALVAAARARRHAARRGALRVGHDPQPRVLSDDVHRLAALRDGERRLGRDRGGRQRRSRRYLALHGRRIDAQPCRRAERRPGLSAEGDGDQRGVQPCGRSCTCCCATRRR